MGIMQGFYGDYMGMIWGASETAARLSTRSSDPFEESYSQH